MHEIQRYLQWLGADGTVAADLVDRQRLPRHPRPKHWAGGFPWAFSGFIGLVFSALDIQRYPNTTAYPLAGVGRLDEIHGSLAQLLHHHRLPDFLHHGL